MITWSAPIYLYLWLAGIAGGAYFAAFLADRFAGEANRKLLRLATYLGIPLAIVGVLLLIVELGQPLRFWHLFTQFKVSSPMSMGTWILLAWVGIAVAMVIFWWIENRLSEQVARSLGRLVGIGAWINLVLAVLLITYTGVLLAVSNRSLWAGTALLPSLFVASAISTGVAILIITAITGRAWRIPNRTIGRLAEADAIIILIELGVLIGYAIWLGGSGLAGTSEALGLLTTGVLAAPFWLGIVLLALLIPLWLDIANWGKEIGTKRVLGAVITSSICVILGGLVLRAVITIGGQL